MKPYFYFLSFFLLISCSIEKNNNHSSIVELTLETRDGYGSFNPSSSVISLEPRDENNPWIKTNVDVSGVPEDWSKAIVKQIWFDARQFAYQNFIADNIDSAMFNDLKVDWNFDPETKSYSKKPIKSFAHIVLSENVDGNVLYRLDTDNDRDFSDEETFKLKNESGIFGSGQTHTLQFEAFRNGKVQELKTKLKISHFPFGILYNFPIHFIASLNDDTIQVSNGFGSTDFRDITSLIVTSIDPASVNDPIELNEFLTIGEQVYQNLGVDANNMVLNLKKLPKDTLLYSTQIGFLAKPFSGTEFTSGEEVGLNNYKGKFLYLDFWGSWCGPCINELPRHVLTYQNIDTSKIQFLGIAKDTPKALKRTIDKFKVEWPQILSDEIPNEYGITGYPTSYLINPEGIITAKNLIGFNFADTLNYYIRNYFSEK